jgi:nitroimidazol reductase NimA-like FMN-containing flavoprotein (pyridoxamine 5'-phosphate oxidase superfamily)
MDTSLYHNKLSEGGPDAAFPETDRTRLKRHPERGDHQRAVVHAILDAGWVCHVGFTGEHGPVVFPTAYGRVGDRLYLHGSPAARLARGARRGEGIDVCVSVTLVDGLVLARSALHHSVNFRSVMVFGTATEVRDPQAKAVALDAFVDHVLPGRSGEARPADERELRATSVLVLPLTEASAKVRTGFGTEEPEDVDLPVWAGVIPLATAVGTPVPDPATAAAGRAVPASASAVARRAG